MSAACAVTLNAQNTTVEFSVTWWGVTTVRGQFEHVAGELIVPNGNISSASMRLDVDAASIRTGIRLRDRHLRGPQFLDAVRHPSIQFSSTSVERVNGAIEVSGLLTLRGAQREVVARCPLGYTNGQGMDATVCMATSIEVPRLPHGIGLAKGIHKLNPLLHAIGSQVTVSVKLLVPAARLLPALLPALGR
ncbi:MAG: YceI family protein [Gemmatimonadaceae bacterium]